MKKHAVCLLSAVPCRAEASDRSEMVSQLLFGDLVEIKDKKDAWLKIKILDDNYPAWVDEKQVLLLDARNYEKLAKSKIHVLEEVVSPLVNTMNKDIQTILLGSRIRGLNVESGEFEMAGLNFRMEGRTRTLPLKVKRKQLIEDAFTYLNAPYLWGGKSPMGIDCSGFVQMVYAMNGMQLPRDASQQADKGHALSFIEEAEEGDLAFFANSDGNIVHVGIMLSNHRIIHASGKVRMDKIDHQGIFREDINDYSHRLRIIKKLL